MTEGTIKQCGVRKDAHSRPIPTHEASWSVSDDTPDGAERLSCDDHLSWVLNWDGVANTVFALVPWWLNSRGRGAS